MSRSRSASDVGRFIEASGVRPSIKIYLIRVPVAIIVRATRSKQRVCGNLLRIAELKEVCSIECGHLHLDFGEIIPSTNRLYCRDQEPI